MNEFDVHRRGPAVRRLVAGTTAAGALSGALVSLGSGAVLGFYGGGILDGPGWGPLLAAYAVALGVAVALALAGVVLASLLPSPPRHPAAAAILATRQPSAATAAPTVATSFPLARNVLLIVIDTLRADHLSCYG